MEELNKHAYGICLKWIFGDYIKIWLEEEYKVAQRPIREYDAKIMLANNWEEYFNGVFKYPAKFVQVSADTDLESLPQQVEWLNNEKLVVKPDVIIGKRGKHGLVLLDQDWETVKEWLKEKLNQEITINNVTGQLTHFLIEPFAKTDREYYISILSKDYGDQILFSEAGGVDIEDEMEKGTLMTIEVPILEGLKNIDLEAKLPSGVEKELRPKIAEFIKGLYRYYIDLGYAFFEINPFVIDGDEFIPLDLKCRVDDAADFEASRKWGDISFPKDFGTKMLPEEEYVKQIDEKSGSSLKLTVLNPKGRVWTMVAGGGASVIYADTIADLGYVEELANYGEYSGDPSTDETYAYAKTILDLMTREKSPDGKPKYLIIGGGIANFTDVVSTFSGVIKALKEYKEKLVSTPVKIYVRRGGPNYQGGLKLMKELGESLGVPIDVYGPETHMTEIVRMALSDANN